MLHDSCQHEPPACEDQAQCEIIGCSPPLAIIEPPDHHHHRASATPSSVPIDLMIPPALRQGDTATLAAQTWPANLQAYMSRRGESPFSCQPKIASGAAENNPLQHGAAAVPWPIRCYSCSFCGREFSSAQALGGHMNIHRRDRARLRTNISQHTSNSVPHHDFPPPTATSTDQITAQDLAPRPRYSSSTQLYLPYQEASFGECQKSSSISQNTYSPSPVMYSTGAALPSFKVGATFMSSPAAVPRDDQHPFDYNSYSAQLSNPIPLPRFESSTHTSATSTFSMLQADPHSSLLQKSSPLIINPRLKSKLVAALNCGSEQVEARASQFRLGVGRSTRASADQYGAHRASADQYGAHAAQQLIQSKEAEVHNKRRGSFADPAVAASSEDRQIGSIQQPSQYYNERRSSANFVTRDSDAVHGIAAVPASSASNDLTTPASNDSMACLDLELRLGRRSSLSAGNRMQPPAPRRPP